MSVEEKRGLHAGVEIGEGSSIAHWLQSRVEANPSNEGAYLTAYVEAFGPTKVARISAATEIISSIGDGLELPDRQPNAAGRFLLSLSDKDLAAAGMQAVTAHHALAFLSRHASERLGTVAASFLYVNDWEDRWLSAEASELLLDYDAQQFEPTIAKAVAGEKCVVRRAPVLEALAKYFPEKYRTQTRSDNLTLLSPPNEGGTHNDPFRWLVQQFGAGILPELERHLSAGQQSYSVTCSLETLSTELGAAGAPGFIAATKHPDHDVRLSALGHLTALANSQYDAVIVSSLETGLAGNDSSQVLKYASLADRWRPDTVAASLWKLFEHKSKPVRQAAARALAKTGKSAVAKASELLLAKKAAIRSAAVTLLAIAESPMAAKALEARVDDETDEEVRDQILLALEQVWEAQGKKISRAQIDRRIERAQDNLQTPIAKWLNEKKLPPLAFAGKPAGKLAPQAVRYLLYRQSRAKNIRADVEAKPLFAMIDRKTSGEFALKVLEMFCGSDMAAEDRWALTVAGLLGDDRIVPPLMQQIRKWIDNNRGKLAEYAAQALALLGGDVALCAVDSLSIRYRSKQKNVGKAAAEAFAEAAERMGLSVDELGDRVVPWLGFEPGQPRLIAEGDKRIEIRIGTDLKLDLRDLAKDKKIGSLPGGISAAVKAEFKDLGVTLREILKGQLPRLENLMVRQYRWPVSKWSELYLVHPILFPFTTRLAWGLYGGDGKLQKLFRALEDRTLTNDNDDSVDLPLKEKHEKHGATIGIVHPLELSGEQRQAWMSHLADYNVESPFLQMERPVVYPAADEVDMKFSSKFAGTDLNGLTFKGRAERLGWHRGSVIDGGGIACYCKSFPGAGADALLSLDGMYIGIDMYTSVKLERLCFVKAGSVKFASYVYDEPSEAQDERLIAFGQVPPIVFSETLGDLEKIAGKKGNDDAVEP
jgi:hypothetical protein